MKTKKNPEIPMVPKAHLKNVEHQRDQYKAENEKLKEQIDTSQVSRLIAEKEQIKQENEKLERENEKQLELLKQFRKLIDYKLTLHQGSSMYREYRSKLDQLGVK